MTGVGLPGPVILAVGLAVSLSMGSLVASLAAVRRMGKMVSTAMELLQEDHPPCETVLKIHKSMEGQSAQLRQLQEHSAVTTVPGPGPPRSGMNLNKRSQVLRMHRIGGSADQIATALELPIQEVHLLLKVQQIILKNL